MDRGIIRYVPPPLASSDTFPSTVQVSQPPPLGCRSIYYETSPYFLCSKTPPALLHSTSTSTLRLYFVLLFTPLRPVSLPSAMSYFTLHSSVKAYLVPFCLRAGEGEELHAPSGQLEAPRCAEGFPLQQVGLRSLQHRVQVRACVREQVCACMSQRKGVMLLTLACWCFGDTEDER